MSFDTLTVFVCNLDHCSDHLNISLMISLVVVAVILIVIPYFTKAKYSLVRIFIYT